MHRPRTRVWLGVLTVAVLVFVAVLIGVAARPASVRWHTVSELRLAQGAEGERVYFTGRVVAYEPGPGGKGRGVYLVADEAHPDTTLRAEYVGAVGVRLEQGSVETFCGQVLGPGKVLVDQIGRGSGPSRYQSPPDAAERER